MINEILDLLPMLREHQRTICKSASQAVREASGGPRERRYVRDVTGLNHSKPSATFTQSIRSAIKVPLLPLRL